MKNGEKINVLHVIRPAEGGMKAHLLYLVRHVNNSFDTFVACPPGLMCKDLQDAGAKVFPVPIRGEISPKDDLVAIKALSTILKSNRIKIMHAHGVKAGLVGRTAAILAKTPFIYYTVHNFFHERFPYWQKKAYMQLEKWLAKPTNRIIAVSNALRNNLIRNVGIKNNGKIITVYNGIDFEKFNSSIQNSNTMKKSLKLKKGFESCPDKPLVGTVARLVKEKGIRYLLEAAAYLKREVNLLIAGAGPQKEELMKTARKLGLGRSVVFAGKQENILPVFLAVDIFVLPSTNEGMGMVILEAMASGKPVVASRVGGIPEIITHGRTGLLVEPGNSAMLAAAIKELLNDPDKARLLSKNGKIMVAQKFSARAMAEKIYDLYKKDLMLLKEG